MKAKIILKARPQRPPVSIPIHTEFIRLGDFLKFSNLAETGGRAKELIEAGEVRVNGEVCLQRGKKLRPGDRVSCAGETLEVTAEA